MSVEKSEKLDYRKIQYAHPTYQMNKILQQAGSQNVTVTVAGGQESIFELPIGVFNIARSELSYTRTIPEAAAGYIYHFKDVQADIRQIQLYTRSGIYLCDLNNAPNYTKIVQKTDVKLEDYLTYDTQTGANTEVGSSGVSRALRRNNVINTSNPSAKRYDNTFANLSYTEPSYIEVGLVQNGAGQGNVVTKVKHPLSLYKNTILALDKDLYAGEVLLLRIVWNSTPRIYFSGTVANNPYTGALSAAGNITISKLQLFLASEKNDQIVSQLRSQVSSGGMSILIPYVHSYKTNLSGGLQSVTREFNRGHGMRLQKIYHSLFTNAENVNSNYDNSNIAGARCSSFYTMLNNMRMQQFDVQPVEYEDYMLMKDKICSSVLQNANIYQYNWCWIDDFTENSNPDEDSIMMSKGNRESGLDLTLEQKWDIYANINAQTFIPAGVLTDQTNHYTYAVTQKMLTIGPSGISVL